MSLLLLKELMILGREEAQDRLECQPRVTHLISISDAALGPGVKGMMRIPESQRIALSFDDCAPSASRFGYVAATRLDVEAIIEFGRVIQASLRASPDSVGSLLVHCEAGVSRSAASLYMILVDALSRTDTGEGRPIDTGTLDVAATVIRSVRSFAHPNGHMLTLAADVFQSEGRLPNHLRTAFINRPYARVYR